MIIPIKAAMYFLALCLLTISLLIFIVAGGVFTSYLYKRIGDSSSWENGYQSLNPFNHIEYFVIILFIITGWFIGMKRPSFLHNWKNGIKGILQKLAYLFVPSLFHLVIASILLFVGVYFFSYQFLLLSFKASLKVNISYITEVCNILHIRGPQLIFVLFSLYSIILNLNLALLNFLFSILDYIIKKYFFEQMLNIKFIFLLYGIVMLLLYIFGNSIMYFFWNIIVIPLLLLF